MSHYGDQFLRIYGNSSQSIKLGLSVVLLFFPCWFRKILIRQRKEIGYIEFTKLSRKPMGAT